MNFLSLYLLQSVCLNWLWWIVACWRHLITDIFCRLPVPAPAAAIKSDAVFVFLCSAWTMDTLPRFKQTPKYLTNQIQSWSFLAWYWHKLGFELDNIWHINIYSRKNRNCKKMSESYYHSSILPQGTVHFRIILDGDYQLIDTRGGLSSLNKHI